ncbi:MAG: PDZ domain-containing protein [Micrococcales bacterium]|nr:PDZ domain-containing protein [Micrococcales bacterium]
MADDLHTVFAPPDDPAPTWAAPGRRSITLGASMLLSGLLTLLLSLLPAPYVVNQPGPTRDVLGEMGGTPLISISGAQTYPSTGQLRLTTVSATGMPGFPAYPFQVLGAWSSPSSRVLPLESQVSSTATREEIDEQNQLQMVSSQELAVVAALTELGYEVPATLTVAGVMDGSGADGVLAKGDIVVGLDGVPTKDYATLIRTLRDTAPGTTVQVDVHRGATRLRVPVVTGERPGGGALLGIVVDPNFDPPVEVTVNVPDIGGPSAGLMFALGIIDMLTPEDEADGAIIAGTGTIDALGEVGPIGGIRQKLVGARRDGAAWFLAPRGNCGEVVGNTPRGLRVVAVSTLHEAREAVVAIGSGKGEGLPTCLPE